MPKFTFKFKKVTDFLSCSWVVPFIHYSFSPLLCPSVHEVLMPYKVLAMLIKEKGETLLVFSLYANSLHLTWRDLREEPNPLSCL